MSKATTILLSLLAGAVLGFFIPRIIGGGAGDFAYDYEDCIKKCDALPQLPELKATRDACIAAAPQPNLTLCQHVPPANQAACVQRELDNWMVATKPCRDAYDAGVEKLGKCRKECNYLLHFDKVQKAN